MSETGYWLWAGVACYAAALLWAATRRDAAPPGKAALALLWLGLLLHAVAIADRWQDSGHGPWISMYEVLSGNIWTLGLMVAVVAPFQRQARAAVIPALAVMLLMAGWMATESPQLVVSPATFDTPILWVHLLFGKIFLGCSLLAAGLGSVLLLRVVRGRDPGGEFGNRALEGAAYRLLAVGVLWETLMLVAGALFAQHAWGRFWGWDPLETMAFLTWVAAVFALHLRAARRPSPLLAAAMPMAVFLLAFLTLFGVPFVTDAPHGGTFVPSGRDA